jgi:hypothetical protein
MTVHRKTQQHSESGRRRRIIPPHGGAKATSEGGVLVSDDNDIVRSDTGKEHEHERRGPQRADDREDREGEVPEVGGNDLSPVLAGSMRLNSFF